MAFIAFEGLDGAGKTTLIESLAAELKAQGKNLILTREPGGTRLAEEIRNILLRTDGEVPHARTELLLYEASRAQHVEKVIKPALADGKWVLCDRFAASSVAFQAFARGLKRSEVDWLNSYAIDGCAPDVYVLLDLPVEESLRRTSKRNTSLGQDNDRFEQEAKDFHFKVRQGFLAQAKEMPQQWLVLDAMQTPAAVFAQLQKSLSEKNLLKNLFADKAKSGSNHE